jgi:hypothetical protein
MRCLIRAHCNKLVETSVEPPHDVLCAINKELDSEITKGRDYFWKIKGRKEENNNKTGLKEFQNVDWVQLCHDGAKWQAIVGRVMNCYP